MSARNPYFATCSPGLEAVLHAEVKALGLRRVERQVGGVAFEGTREDAWTANLWLRSAIRVLERVTRFEARDADELYAGAREVAWERFLAPTGSLVVDARSNRSLLDHTQFVEQRVKDAIVDHFRETTGERPSVDKNDPDMRINAHVFKDRVTLSLDTSGHSLHRRGWRRHQGRAPLAETTAAAMVLMSGWNGRAPLLDPFCGTGTILIEAAWIAAGIAPGAMRSFGFERWNDHDAKRFARAKQAASSKGALPGKLRLLGSDNDRERIAEAHENAAAAGLEGRIEFEVASASDFAPRPGWNATIVTNPPYGLRVGRGDELERTYHDFGERLRRRCEGYSLHLLTANPMLCDRLGFAGAPRQAIINGGLECEVLQVERI